MTALWTIMPPETIFPPTAETPAYREAIYRGVLMQVQEADDAHWQIVRLLSGNPEDYLRPALQPGRRIAKASSDTR